jgi:hypothetical protein
MLMIHGAFAFAAIWIFGLLWVYTFLPDGLAGGAVCPARS